MSINKTIAFFGCKNITKTCMENFRNRVDTIRYLISISPEMGLKNKVSGYMDLKDFADDNKIKYYAVNNYTLKDKTDIDLINSLNIDVAFVIGWQRLIPSQILGNLNIGIFGMHGSSDNLPKGRGRSPMNWSLILGKKQFYTNLFKYENNIDGGGIIGTHCFDIKENDTIETLHFKNMLSMNMLIEKNYDNIINNNFKLKIQNEEKATYFPKREPSDGVIDWNIKTKNIINLSKALTHPFPGCYSTIKGEKITIWRMNVFSNSFEYTRAEQGEIIQVFYNNKFLVKTADSVVIVHEYDTRNSNLIKSGNKFDIVDLKSVYKIFEKRYPNFVKRNQMEITLDKMIKGNYIG